SPMTSAARAASCARSSRDPRVPSSPSVRSTTATLWPFATSEMSRPPQVISTSSGCGPKATTWYSLIIPVPNVEVGFHRPLETARWHATRGEEKLSRTLTDSEQMIPPSPAEDLPERARSEAAQTDEK